MHYRRWRLYGDTGLAGSTYGEGSYTPFGYRLISINGKQRFEHRIVMERILGRPLRKDEEVHHKDGCPWNNDPDNLVVLSGPEHRHVHSARPYGTECAEHRDDIQRPKRPYYRQISGGKRCASCLKFLPLTSFYRTKHLPTSYCQECHAMRVKASRIKTGRARLTCADCGVATAGGGLRCRSCAIKRWRPKAQAFCADCGVPITPNKGYKRCRSCGRKDLLRRRPDLIPGKRHLGQFVQG